jgi:hypothetical protein
MVAQGPEYEFQVEDATALPGRFRTSFQIVLACHLIEHLPDKRTGIQAMAECLSDGGHLALSFWPQTPEEVPPYWFVYSAAGILDQERQGFGLDRADVIDDMEASGLEIRVNESVSYLTAILDEPTQLVAQWLLGSHWGHNNLDRHHAIMSAAKSLPVQEHIVSRSDG